MYKYERLASIVAGISSERNHCFPTNKCQEMRKSNTLFIGKDRETMEIPGRIVPVIWREARRLQKLNSCTNKIHSGDQ